MATSQVAQPATTDVESSKPWNLDRWIGVIGAAAGVVGLVITIIAVIWPDKVKDWALHLIAEDWSGRLIVALCIVLLIGISVTLWRTRILGKTRQAVVDSQREVKKLNDRLARITENLSNAMAGKEMDFNKELEPESILKDFVPWQKIPERRWEKIKSVEYGHLEYAPFLKYASNGKPEGLAVSLLTELLQPSGSLDIEVRHEQAKRNWPNVIDGLINGQCDVVATPLFETFDRAKKVRFTAPMFFSNIGLYVSRRNAERSTWDDVSPATLHQAIKDAGDLKLLAVPGEISHYLAQKYVSEDQIKPQPTDAVFTSLFDRVATDNNPPTAIFCETFRAHLEPTVANNKVRNVLAGHQILYPVCFAVRRGDYQLANLLNIRLLQFSQDHSMLNYLSESLATILGYNLDDEKNRSEDERKRREDDRKAKIKEHFAFEWPA